MKRSFYFCKSWFRAKKRPTEVWTEDQARAAHEKKEHYTVLVDSINKPFCFIDVADKIVGVGFLDENLRECLSYDFQEFESGKLFLTIATYREFEGEGDKVISGTTYIFQQDGKVHLRRESFNPHKLELSEVSSEVGGNYSVMPEFGKYEDLIRIDRG